MNGPRRFTLVGTALIGLAANTFSQEYINVLLIEASCDSLVARITVFFPFGYGGTCPSLSGSILQPGDVTAAINLYYDISGPWPQVGCTTSDTIATALPSGNPFVHISTFSIVDGDTSDVVSDTLLHVCATGFNEAPTKAPALSLSVQGDYLVLSPVSAIQDARLEFFDPSGNLLRAERRAAEKTHIGSMPSGLYLVRSVSSWNTTVLRFVRP